MDEARGGRAEKRAGVEPSEGADAGKLERVRAGRRGDQPQPCPHNPRPSATPLHRLGWGTDATSWGWWLSKAPRGAKGRQARSPESRCQEMRPQSPNLSPEPPPRWGLQLAGAPLHHPFSPEAPTSHPTVHGRSPGVSTRQERRPWRQREFIFSTCRVP